MGAEPALAAERERLRGLLAREQKSQATAFGMVLDSGSADRIAARILDRARRSESRHAPAPARKSIWVRLLAVSIAAHVVALCFFSWRHFRPAADAPDAERPNSVTLNPASPHDAVLGDEGTDLDSPEPPLGPYVLPVAVGDEGTAPFEEWLPPRADPLDPVLQNSFSSVNRRGMWVRTNDTMKGMIETRLGTPDLRTRVKAGLAAMAKLQANDGSFADAAGHASARATATVLLAFLGDGNSSYGGEHRAVVERGIDWLAASLPSRSSSDGPLENRAPFIDRSLSLFALSEDLILSSAAMTPAESGIRRAALVSLAQSVRDARRTEVSIAATDARWAELALEAASRSGVGGYATVAIAATFDVTSIRPGNDVRTAMLDGSVLLKDRRMLKDRRTAAFTEWNAATARILSSRLGADGLVQGTTPASGRAEETALILLAFEVAYRTY